MNLKSLRVPYADGRLGSNERSLITFQGLLGPCVAVSMTNEQCSCSRCYVIGSIADHCNFKTLVVSLLEYLVVLVGAWCTRYELDNQQVSKQSQVYDS